MEQQPDASRRVVIKGVAALGLAGAAGLPLAACGGGASGEAAGPAPAPTSPAVAAPPSPVPRATKTRAAGRRTATSTPEPTPKPGAATAKPAKKPKATATAAAMPVPQGPPIADAAEIPVGSGTLFEIDELIVTQPAAGDFRGFSSLCPHEGCVIDVFEGDQMICACHNSRFRIADGETVRGPARQPVPRRPIVVVDGKVYRA